MARKSITAHKLHRWAGLTAAVWLLILGLTGFFIDHREWRWEWNNTVPEAFVPDRVIKSARMAAMRGLIANPDNPDQQVVIGERGVWVTEDGGNHWKLAQFRDASQAALRPVAILPDPVIGWKKLWLATSNGLWAGAEGGKIFEPVALQGEEITSLTEGASPDQLIAVLDRSTIVKVGLGSPVTIDTLAPSIPASAWPETFTLARYLHDLHVGKGIADRTTSILINDFAGLAWVILGISGVLYWWLPKRWKNQRRAGKPEVPVQQRRKTLVWLFNTHSSVLGILVAIPLLYLGLSGIYWDHMSELGSWARSIPVSRSWLTPAFTQPRWDNWIDGATVAKAPSGDLRWTVVGRMGVLSSSDNGVSWQRDGVGEQPFVESRRLFRIGEQLLIGNASLPSAPAREHAGHGSGGMAASSGMGRMGALFLWHSNGQHWLRLNQFKKLLAEQKNNAMPTEVSRWKPGQLFWRAGETAYITNDALTTLIAVLPLTPPTPEGVPLAMIFSKLHSGVFFWTEWKWINDAVVVLSFVLLVTGLIRWWKKKWLSSKPVTNNTH